MGKYTVIRVFPPSIDPGMLQQDNFRRLSLFQLQLLLGLHSKEKCA
jgi:hypothetical protein